MYVIVWCVRLYGRITQELYFPLVWYVMVCVSVWEDGPRALVSVCSYTENCNRCAISKSQCQCDVSRV